MTNQEIILEKIAAQEKENQELRLENEQLKQKLETTQSIVDEILFGGM